MSFLVSPEMQLEIGGKAYTLSPTTACLKKIQQEFKKDILAVMLEMPRMTFDEQAKIIAIAIEDFGDVPPALSVIEEWIVDEVGLTAIRNILQGWLLVITSPKKEREAQMKTVGERLGALGI